MPPGQLGRGGIPDGRGIPGGRWRHPGRGLTTLALVSSFRSSVERVSVGPLTAISQLHRAVVFLVILALMVGGALLSWGWVLLLVVAVFLAWILYLAWPRLNGVERLMRTAILALVIAIAIARAFPQ